MITRASFVGTLAFGVASALAIPAAAQQTFTVTRPAGELGVGLDANRSTVPSLAKRGLRTFHEWIRLQMSGAVLDPRFLRFSLNVRPGFSQTAFFGEPHSPDGAGTSFTGSANVTLLSSSLVSLSLQGSRIDADQRARLGAYTEIDATQLRATLNHRNRYLPMQLTFEEDDRSQSFESGTTPSTFRIATRTRTGRFRATNRRLRIALDQVSFLDRLTGRNYRLRNGVLSHRLTWGKGSQLLSELSGRQRMGTNPFRRLSWRESVRIQHTQKVSSEMWFQRTGESRAVGRAGETTGSAALTFQALPGLGVDATAYTQHRDLALGSLRYSRIGPGVNLTTPLPLGILLRATGTLGYEWHGQDPKLEGSVDVVDEPHVVSPSGRFQLDRPFADPSSILISSEDGAEVFQEDFDYRAVVAGPFVEILSLPGGRMPPGTSVRVDYRHTLLAGAFSNAWVTDLDVALLIGSGVRLYHRRSVQTATDDVIPGTLSALRNYDFLTAGASLNAAVPVGTVGIGGEYSRRTTDTFDNDTFRFQGRWSFLLANRLRWLLSGSHTTQWASGIITLVLTEARGGLEWPFMEDLSLDGQLVYWKWREPARLENFLGGELRVRWAPGLVIAEMGYERLVWENFNPRTEERVMVRLSRSF
jgi:hypothetical protein